MLTCVPSYGRDYKTAKEVKAAWDAAKDFTVCDMSSPDDGRQINKQDADTGKVTVHIYFAGRTKSVVIKPRTGNPAACRVACFTNTRGAALA